ncbi:hypothetical protein EXIGLDRAFT_674296 [Exidia glandulosa HHB12029]|uniref:Integrase catalytic domain-containing protein n=1 Tax=Exidia glandulosa HHB12029 TaxID=1314781 RepID=A0A165IC45_EXIGL|nr:hypothetical protein EXIGLDRAFT_674296 [Exidia glandulosa HHB12029]
MYPWLPSVIQKLIWENVKVKDLADHISRVHELEISQRSIERIKQQCNIMTARRNNGDETLWAAAIAQKQDEIDPLRRMGIRELQDALREDHVMIPRAFIESFARVTEPQAVASRSASYRKKHTAGLWSIGPDEEWSFDGHEKLCKEMNLPIYCGVDKYSRFILGLYVVARHQQPDVGAAIYALCVDKHGRSPIQSVTDMGPETSHMAVLQRSVYARVYPGLNPDEIPPHQFRKSTENITVERLWRRLYEKLFSNILEIYLRGRFDAGFLQARPDHRVLARWIWAQAVQKRIDEYVVQYNNHRIRSQKSNLPSGARPTDIYNNPEKYGGIRSCSKSLDSNWTKEIVERYVPSDIFQFGTDEEVAVLDAVYAAVGAPDIGVNCAWDIFRAMRPLVEFEMADFEFGQQEDNDGRDI